MELCIGAASLSSGNQTDHAKELAIVEACRRKDYEAFGKLLDAYQNRVFGFVRRMVPNAEEAADITQEVFIRAFQNFHRFDARSSVRTWLFRIAYNLCVDRARKVDRSPTEVSLQGTVEIDETFDVPDGRWQPDQLAIDAEIAAAIDVAISTMSEKLKTVLLLHDKEDLPYDEIAELVGVPVGTVKSRLFLARAHLQQHLRNYLRAEVS
jgi:RNA polymerase sigma-70 factor (ECF subfamily)